MQLPCSPCPSVDKKGLRCSPCPSAALRGQKRVFFVVLRGPPRPSVDKKRSSSRPFADKKGFSSWSFVVLRGPPRRSVDKKRSSSRPFAPLRGQNGVKVFLVAGHCIKLGQTHLRLPESVGAPLVGALRGLLWRPNLDAIALFSLPLRGQEGSKMFSVPLRGPPWTKRV